MESEQPEFPEVVCLNVGGRHFTTSLSTLRRREDSMLAAMFSGRHHVAKDKDGRYFIDRDGTNFGHILNFLRSDHLPPPDVAASVVTEAEFFGIYDLVGWRSSESAGVRLSRLVFGTEVLESVGWFRLVLGTVGYRALADLAEHQPNTSRPISDPPSRAECFEIFKTFGWRSRTPDDSAERQPTRPNANRASSRITPESLQPWSGESREAMFGYV
ncbi:KCTD7 [Branchiostoma lanceolatum]|uniref:KCTD7 protein n=1 Tax=Branchiostoma lanceolatum TaxID=7740 RepID=A0A8S4MLU2_BRALA|nr:KCTD7 [Branchiostoma lanceolatum]